MENKESISFQLIDIEVDEFAILEPSIPNEGVQFVSRLQFTVDDKEEKIICSTIIEFILEKSVLMKLKTDVFFQIKPGHWKNFESDNKIKIPKAFLAHLGMISVGTTRGILFLKTENTTFRNFTLPLINITNMIDDDINIDLE